MAKKKAIRNMTQSAPANKEVTGNTPRAYMDTPAGKGAQKARGGGGTIKIKLGKIPNK